MVVASAAASVSEVMEVDRFSVGSISARGDTGFSCKCHELSPKLHRSYREREGMSKRLDYCVTYSCVDLEMSQTQLCIHVVISDSKNCFLNLQSVLLDGGNWLAVMVNPRSLVVDYCILLRISLQPSCSIAGCLEHFNFFLFFFFFYFFPLRKQSIPKLLFKILIASSTEDDIETQVTRYNHTICGIAVRGNSEDLF